MRRWFSVTALGAITLVSVALAAQTPPSPVAPIDSPAGAASSVPRLSVSTRGVLLSWVERAGTTATLKFAERTPAGWTAPIVVASGTDWFVNWADVPSVLRLDNGTLAAHWLQKSGADTYAYDVRLSHSTDAGKTWSAPVRPHHDGTKTEHGFASLVQMAGGGLGLIWLDGRAMTPGAHDGHGGGSMSLRFTSYDRAWKQEAETAIDTKVCECCPTAAAVTSEGVIAAFRNRSDTEIRDIHVSRLVNGRWTDSVPVHADNWQLNSCPVNGPALSANSRDVALAWFTTQNNQGQAYVAFSSDAGRTFTSPMRVDDGGTLGRVDVALVPGGDALVTWIEFQPGKAEFRARRVARTGARSAPFTIAAISTSRASGYPRMAISGNEIVYAWTDGTGSATSVRTAVSAIPPR